MGRYRYNGGRLRVSGARAIHADCCCEEDPCADALDFAKNGWTSVDIEMPGDGSDGCSTYCSEFSCQTDGNTYTFYEADDSEVLGANGYSYGTNLSTHCVLGLSLTCTNFGDLRAEVGVTGLNAFGTAVVSRYIFRLDYSGALPPSGSLMLPFYSYQAFTIDFCCPCGCKYDASSDDVVLTFT